MARPTRTAAVLGVQGRGHCLPGCFGTSVFLLLSKPRLGYAAHTVPHVANLSLALPCLSVRHSPFCIPVIGVLPSAVVRCSIRCVVSDVLSKLFSAALHWLCQGIAPPKAFRPVSLLFLGCCVATCTWCYPSGSMPTVLPHIHCSAMPRHLASPPPSGFDSCAFERSAPLGCFVCGPCSTDVAPATPHVAVCFTCQVLPLAAIGPLSGGRACSIADMTSQHRLWSAQLAAGSQSCRFPAAMCGNARAA